MSSVQEKIVERIAYSDALCRELDSYLCSFLNAPEGVGFSHLNRLSGASICTRYGTIIVGELDSDPDAELRAERVDIEITSSGKIAASALTRLIDKTLKEDKVELDFDTHDDVYDMSARIILLLSELSDNPICKALYRKLVRELAPDAQSDLSQHFDK